MSSSPFLIGGLHLVCVRCRGAVDGRLHWQNLSLEGPFLRCACGAHYPMIDGIPVIFSDQDAFLASEGPLLLKREDLPEALLAVLEPQSKGAIARDRELRRVYQNSTEGPLQDQLRHLLKGGEGPTLEMGAGLGISSHSLRLDHGFGILRAGLGPAVCADAHDPPFSPASFRRVVLANILDSCRDPALILAQADALLPVGGQLILSCAFAFKEEITPKENWISEASLSAMLHGELHPYGQSLSYQSTLEMDLDWPLNLSARQRHVHRTRLWVGSKLAPR